jgi:hypothetical protein
MKNKYFVVISNLVFGGADTETAAALKLINEEVNTLNSQDREFLITDFFIDFEDLPNIRLKNINNRIEFFDSTYVKFATVLFVEVKNE